MYIYRGFRYAGPIKVREELAWRENDCRGHQPPAARSKTRLLNLDAEIEQNGVQTAQKMHAVVSLLPLNTTKSTSTFYSVAKMHGKSSGTRKFHVGSNQPRTMSVHAIHWRIRQYMHVDYSYMLPGYTTSLLQVWFHDTSRDRSLWLIETDIKYHISLKIHSDH